MNRIDCRNWPCPKPVIEVRKALLAAPAAPLGVIVEDAITRQNLQRLGAGLGRKVRAVELDGLAALEFAPADADAAAAAAGGATVVLVSAETMGSGNDELGRILLRNFLITLAEFETPPETIYFINAGVKLAVQGAETVEILERLACAGVDVAACGLCLDFFKLKEQLAVGRVTNMLDIVQGMANAARVLRP